MDHSSIASSHYRWRRVWLFSKDSVIRVLVLAKNSVSRTLLCYNLIVKFLSYKLKRMLPMKYFERMAQKFFFKYVCQKNVTTMSLKWWDLWNWSFNGKEWHFWKKRKKERERQSESEREREIEKVQDRIQITLNRKSCHSHTWVNIRKWRLFENHLKSTF